MFRSTARTRQAWATLRYRLATDADKRLAAAGRRPSLPVDTGHQLAVEFVERGRPSLHPSLARVGPDRSRRSDRGHRRDTCRSSSGGTGALRCRTSGTNRLIASIADVRVRGCHSGHCSASHSRTHVNSGRSSGAGLHDSGSPVARSNRSPSRSATTSRERCVGGSLRSEGTGPLLPVDPPPHDPWHRCVRGAPADPGCPRCGRLVSVWPWRSG